MNKYTPQQEFDRELYLATYEGEDRMVTSHELNEMLQKQPVVPKIKTGFSQLDEVLQDVEAGELIVLSGPSAEGKSTLMRTITKNIADKHKCIWFNFEDSNRQFFSRFKGNPPLFYMPAANLDNTVAWMNDRIDEARKKYFAEGELGVVFIDHLHAILTQMRFQGHLSLEIGDITQKIKDFATQKNLIVFLGAHCLDLPEKSVKDYRKSHVRDSGLINRIADTVLLIWRVPNSYQWGQKLRIEDEITNFDSKAILKVDKNRREGTCSKIFLNHKEHFFYPIDFMHQDDEPHEPIIQDDTQISFV